MKVVAVVSGGLDSVVMAHQLVAEGHEVALLSVDYGQKHKTELRYAADCGIRLGVPWTLVDLWAARQAFAGSALTDQAVDVPSGHYEDESMRSTIVPNRNMILLALATARALSSGAGAIAFGPHGGDHAVYPDCREEFADAMRRAMALCDHRPILLLAPFAGARKANIVALGSHLGVPFERTWSCYRGGDHHCGRCGTCVERREAFALAGVPDPTAYLA